ncbi:hypothetical protein GGR92_004389 [Spirosoma lacussanchae]|uniref:hypothetical protein n=1 Tax=Spirosoma lacussanchae TaxID=1884249 RepID=UPI001109D0A0|nr:hypothetical protein [Spirosoma lacussanchae]
MNQPQPRQFAVSFCQLVCTIAVITSLAACRMGAGSGSARPMKVAVGAIQEVTLTGKSVVGTSDNQEVVDVTTKPLSSADSSAQAQGKAVATTFLIKGVTVGTARVVFAEQAADSSPDGRVRQTYAVQVVSQ